MRILGPGFTKESSIDLLSAAMTLEKIESQSSSLYAILYQAGYLTIKEANHGALKLCIPNHEARTAFADALIQKLTCENYDYASLKGAHAQKLTDALNKKHDYEAVRDEFDRLLGKLSLSAVAADEASFCKILSGVLSAIDLKCTHETFFKTGGDFLTIDTGELLYVFKFKLADNAQQIPKLLEDAEGQIATLNLCAEEAHKTVIACAVVMLKAGQGSKRSQDRHPDFTVERVCEIEASPIILPPGLNPFCTRGSRTHDLTALKPALCLSRGAQFDALNRSAKKSPNGVYFHKVLLQ